METIINNNNLDQLLDGYTTANVEGRLMLSSSLDTQSVPGRNGDVVMAQTLPAREITVHFVLKAKNSVGYIKKCRELNKLIQTDRESKLSFSDEKGFWRVYSSKVDAPPYDWKEGTGAITFHCADPFLHGEIKQFKDLSSKANSNAYALRLNKALLEANGKVILKNATTGVRIAFVKALTGQLLITQDAITLNGENIVPSLDIQSSTWKGFTIHPGDTITAEGATGSTLWIEELYL
ncbi:distal tail protein Dit [Levyella massiliensis]|jgi:predicted phage tail component-like protein|uniref:distal tail protein Dit n=1 Tax=Levyella massiliensis TaxID=938289 RepID=UPI003EB74607